MSNANRDYAIVYDVKNSSLVLSRPLVFYITDKNTSNIFVRLVTRVSVGNGIDQYTNIEEASNYVLTMRVIKPNNEVKSIEATQHETESIFQFDLTEDFKDIAGKYICELTISTIVNGRQELITSDPFNYEVKRSILSNVGEIIETEDTTVEKLLNDLDATKAELNLQVKDIQNKINFVDDFGAVGDGVNDDTKAIQNALDKQGIVILSKNKTYRITHTILLKDDTLFLGQNSTIYYDANTSSAISVYKYKGDTSTTKNIILRDFNVKQRPYDDKANCDVNAIWLPFCENILVENVSSENIRWHLLDIPSSKNVIVRNCRAKNHGSAAIQIDGTLLQSGTVLLKDGSQDTNSFVKMGCDNVIVENCVSIDCETGVHMHRDGGKNIKIINNTIKGCSYSGILSDENQEWNNLIIKNNHLENCCQGIHLRGYGRNYNISDNKLIGNNNNTDMGLRLGFSLNGNDFYGDVVILGNLISNYFRAGFIQQAENININNNIFKECGYTIDTITNQNNKNDIFRYAINLDNVKNSTIANNSFVKNYFCDIQLKKIFNVDIINNKSNSSGNFINGSSSTELKKELRIINNSIANDNAFNSINLDTIEDVYMNGNKIKQTSNNCILIVNAKKGNVVNNNLISESGTFGIRLYNADSYFNENKINGFTTPYSFEGGDGTCNVSGVLFDTPSRAGTVNGVITYYASSTPPHDSFDVGSKIINTSPVNGGCIGWIKTGSFTWKKFATFES